MSTLALKWGAVAVSGLSGVLVGTHKLVNYGNPVSSTVELTGLEQVSSPNLSNPLIPINTSEIKQVVSSLAPTEKSELIIKELPIEQVVSVNEENNSGGGGGYQLEFSSTGNLEQNYREEKGKSENQATEDSSKLVTTNSQSITEEALTTEVSSQVEVTPSTSEETKLPSVSTESQSTQEDLDTQQEINIESLKPENFNVAKFEATGSQTNPLKVEPTITSPETQSPMALTVATSETTVTQVISAQEAPQDTKLPQESPDKTLIQVADVEAKVEPVAPVKPRELTKEEIKAQADSIFEKLDDYTFKLFSSCNTGSGWILDYQIPDQKDKYPLIWYIATNAHVVNHWHFDHTNPYKQILPTKLDAYTQKWQDYYTNYASRYYSLASSDNCYYQTWYGAFDMNLSKQSSGKTLRSDRGAIYQKKIKRPRLFWTGLNLFKENKDLEIKKDNFQDFVVMEIEFTSEKVAREMTRDFAKKYTTESNNAINIFGAPISRERATESNENFYGLGYSGKSKDKFSYSKTWNPSTLEGEKLVKDPRKRETITHDKKLRGHLGTQSFTKSEIEWGGKKYRRLGHFYFLKGFPMGKGVSGSMDVDGEGNLLGLRTSEEQGDNARYSMITPIRSEALEVEGDFKTPKYDLILGAEGQNSSYREQIEAYNKKTWLSSMNWKHHSDKSKST